MSALGAVRAVTVVRGDALPQGRRVADVRRVSALGRRLEALPGVVHQGRVRAPRPAVRLHAHLGARLHVRPRRSPRRLDRRPAARRLLSRSARLSATGERKRAVTVGTVPLQSAQCRGSLGWPFPVLKFELSCRINYTEAPFVKQHSETVMVRNCRNSDCSLRKLFIIISAHFRSL